MKIPPSIFRSVTFGVLLGGSNRSPADSGSRASYWLGDTLFSASNISARGCSKHLKSKLEDK